MVAGSEVLSLGLKQGLPRSKWRNTTTLQPHYNTPHYNAFFTITRPSHGSKTDYFIIYVNRK